MTTDGQTIATKKNRLEKIHLSQKLERLEREKKSELRMLNNNKQKLRSKYQGFYGTHSSRDSDVSIVIFLQT